MGYFYVANYTDAMTTNVDFANMLQTFLAAQQSVAQEQQNMMREFLREQARTRAEDNDRRASQAPMPPDMSDSDDVDDDGGEYRVKENGKLISKHIKPDTFNGDMFQMG